MPAGTEGGLTFGKHQLNKYIKRPIILISSPKRWDSRRTNTCPGNAARKWWS